MKMSKMDSNEETLRKGSMPTGNGGLKSSGNKNAEMDKTTSDGKSNLESLRQGSIPKPEAVKDVTFDQGCLARARMLNERSENGGAEKEGGW
jgi:hypothetical protein